MKGIIINLDAATDRLQTILADIGSSGLSPSNYVRFPAICPQVGTRLPSGLQTKGELGIWLSLVQVLKSIGVSGHPGFVHVLEDDASFPPDIGKSFESVLASLDQDAKLSNIDLVFTDYFINASLATYVNEFINANPGRHGLIAANDKYIGCCSSFLLRTSSADYLSITLSRILASGVSIAPVDLVIRELINNGIINAVLVVPPLTCPSWESDEHSYIQNHEDSERRKSQRAHLLLRILLSGRHNPSWCIQRLSEVLSIPPPDCTQASRDVFIQFFIKHLDSLSVF